MIKEHIIDDLLLVRYTLKKKNLYVFFYILGIAFIDEKILFT